MQTTAMGREVIFGQSAPLHQRCNGTQFNKGIADTGGCQRSAYVGMIEAFSDLACQPAPHHMVFSSHDNGVIIRKGGNRLGIKRL